MPFDQDFNQRATTVTTPVQEINAIVEQFTPSMFDPLKIYAFGDEAAIAAAESLSSIIKLQVKFNDLSRRAIFELTTQQNDPAATLQKLNEFKEKLSNADKRASHSFRQLANHLQAGETIDYNYDDLRAEDSSVGSFQLAFRSNQKKLNIAMDSLTDGLNIAHNMNNNLGALRQTFQKKQDGAHPRPAVLKA